MTLLAQLLGVCLEQAGEHDGGRTSAGESENRESERSYLEGRWRTPFEDG